MNGRMAALWNRLNVEAQWQENESQKEIRKCQRVCRHDRGRAGQGLDLERERESVRTRGGGERAHGEGPVSEIELWTPSAILSLSLRLSLPSVTLLPQQDLFSLAAQELNRRLAVLGWIAPNLSRTWPGHISPLILKKKKKKKSEIMFCSVKIKSVLWATKIKHIACELRGVGGV